MYVDQAKLYDMVKEQKSASEIMNTLSISSKNSLVQALYNLSLDKNEVLKVSGLAQQNPNVRKLTKSGISLPSSILQAKYPEGTEFKLDMHDEKIVLNIVH